MGCPFRVVQTEVHSTSSSSDLCQLNHSLHWERRTEHVDVLNSSGGFFRPGPELGWVLQAFGCYPHPLPPDITRLPLVPSREMQTRIHCIGEKRFGGFRYKGWISKRDAELCVFWSSTDFHFHPTETSFDLDYKVFVKEKGWSEAKIQLEVKHMWWNTMEWQLYQRWHDCMFHFHRSGSNLL